MELPGKKLQEELKEQNRLAKKLKDFDNKWVAVIGDNIVESSDDWDELVEKVKDRNDVLCFHVSNKPRIYNRIQSFRLAS